MSNRFENFTTYTLLLNRYIQKAKEKEMKQFNLHATHTMCLYYLYRNKDGLTSKDLCDLCKEDKAAISRTIKSLIDLGYVYLDKEDNKKNYLNLLFLTTKGEEIAKMMNDRINHLLKKLGNGISLEDRKKLYELLKIILNNFENYMNE